MEVLSASSGLKILSSQFLNVSLMSACFEPRCGGEEPRLAVDYYDLEAQQISPMKTIPSLAAPSLAAANFTLRMKKMKGRVKHLGHLRIGLDQALVALIEGLFVGWTCCPKESGTS